MTVPVALLIASPALFPLFASEGLLGGLQAYIEIGLHLGSAGQCVPTHGGVTMLRTDSAAPSDDNTGESGARDRSVRGKVGRKAGARGHSYGNRSLLYRVIVTVRQQCADSFPP